VDINAFRDYYEFDDDDVYANQMGRLSDKQYRTLAQASAGTQRFARLGAIVALVAAASLPCLLLPVSLITLFAGDWNHTFLAWAGCLVWLAIFGGAGLWLLRLARRPQDLNPSVTRVEGPVTIRSERRTSGGEHSRTYTVYMIKIGETEFGLDDELVGHIHDGDSLSVYYTGGEILSVEPA
jgi:hypothetical protein